MAALSSRTLRAHGGRRVWSGVSGPSRQELPGTTSRLSERRVSEAHEPNQAVPSPHCPTHRRQIVTIGMSSGRYTGSDDGAYGRCARVCAPCGARWRDRCARSSIRQPSTRAGRPARRLRRAGDATASAGQLGWPSTGLSGAAASEWRIGTAGPARTTGRAVGMSGAASPSCLHVGK